MAKWSGSQSDVLPLRELKIFQKLLKNAILVSFFFQNFASGAESVAKTVSI